MNKGNCSKKEYYSHNHDETGWIPVKKPFDADSNETVLKYVIAIGVSTGGPRSLPLILSQLPADFPAALLIVQHMPSGFTRSLAERLNNLSRIRVKEAEDGEIVEAGCAYIAPGDFHMKIVRTRKNLLAVSLSDEPPISGHRPSIDVMMKSLSDTGFTNIIGVIMTGMGSDGSKGIVKLKKKNKAVIIAQDEESSVVYGMPKAALQTGAVDKVVPLTEIAQEIMKIVEVQD